MFRSCASMSHDVNPHAVIVALDSLACSTRPLHHAEPSAASTKREVAGDEELALRLEVALDGCEYATWLLHRLMEVPEGFVPSDFVAQCLLDLPPSCGALGVAPGVVAAGSDTA